jgi:hypothetical protein
VVAAGGASGADATAIATGTIITVTGIANAGRGCRASTIRAAISRCRFRAKRGCTTTFQ